jgi:hypothetical protein
MENPKAAIFGRTVLQTRQGAIPDDGIRAFKGRGLWITMLIGVEHTLPHYPCIYGYQIIPTSRSKFIAELAQRNYGSDY